jgi:hypothetical protein
MYKKQMANAYSTMMWRGGHPPDMAVSMFRDGSANKLVAYTIAFWAGPETFK